MSLSSYKNNMPKFSHHNNIYFLSYALPRYIKCFFHHTYRNNNIICKKGYFLRKTQNSWVNTSRILKIKNATLQGDIVFICTQTYSEIFKSALVYLKRRRSEKIYEIYFEILFNFELPILPE